jgi:hypothetical protein
MTDREDRWQPQDPRQDYGRPSPQEPPWQQDQQWQPQQYDPRAHQQRLQPQQDAAWQQQGYGQPPYPPPQYGQQPGGGQPPQQAYPQQQPYAPQQPPAPQLPVQQGLGRRRSKSWPARHKLLSGLIAAGAIVFIAVAASASNKPSTPAANTGAAGSSTSPSAAVSSAPASVARSTSAAVSSAPASPAQSTPAAPASPSMTGAQQQAVDAAEGYLSEGQGFSKQGLLGQLTSSFGNGFGQADAEFAINYLKPNWDAQAVDAASGYLSEGQGFSQQGLVQQLTSSAGSGFTDAQAEYAISSQHPDWDAQAVDAAKGYMQMGGFSRASLIQQLTSSAGSGFTQAQAQYAASQVGL